MFFLQAGYYFAPTSINFRELYNVTADYYMLKNIYAEASEELKGLLHDRLQQALACKGSAQCEGHLQLP